MAHTLYSLHVVVFKSNWSLATDDIHLSKADADQFIVDQGPEIAEHLITVILDDYIDRRREEARDEGYTAGYSESSI